MQTAALFTVMILLTANAVANEVNMIIEQSGGTKCGENVTLLCRLSSQENEAVVELSWILELTENSMKVLCNSSKTEKREFNRIHCKYEHDKHLALTIEDLQQSDNGTYFCKVQTRNGHNSIRIPLNITDCDEWSALPKQEQIQNHAGASESKRIHLLASLTALLSLILDSGI